MNSSQINSDQTNKLFSQEILQRAAKVKLAIFDVDGIFTDGRLYFSPEGDEMKVFHVRDGFGIKAIQRAGVKVAIISGRKGPAVTKRMQSLGVEHVYQGFEDKLPIYQELLGKLGLTSEQTSYMGDDVPDIPVLHACGLPMTVADAHHSVMPHALYVTPQGGGQGAVRQACELLLAAQD